MSFFDIILLLDNVVNSIKNLKIYSSVFPFYINVKFPKNK